MTQECVDELSFEREKWKYRRRAFIAIEAFCGLFYVVMAFIGDPSNTLHTNFLDGLEGMAFITLVSYFGGAGVSEVIKGRNRHA